MKIKNPKHDYITYILLIAIVLFNIKMLHYTYVEELIKFFMISVINISLFSGLLVIYYKYNKNKMRKYNENSTIH